MEIKDKFVKIGMISVLTAVRKTLSLYTDGMTADEINDMINEIDQQLGVKETEIQLLKAG